MKQIKRMYNRIKWRWFWKRNEKRILFELHRRVKAEFYWLYVSKFRKQNKNIKK